MINLFFVLLFVVVGVAQEADLMQDPNKILSKSREIFAGNLRVTVRANGFLQKRAQRLRSDGGMDVREEFPLGTNTLGEINDLYDRVLISNRDSDYEVFPIGGIARNLIQPLRSSSDFAGLVLSNDLFFVSKWMVQTNQNSPNFEVAIEYSESVWNQLKFRLREDPRVAFRTVYVIDKTTLLPVAATSLNREGQIVGGVEFVSIEPNPVFSEQEFFMEKDTTMLSGLSMEQESHIVSKIAVINARKLGKRPRFLKNPSAPTFSQVDPVMVRKIVASNLARIKSGDLIIKSESQSYGKVVFVVLMGLAFCLPILLALFRFYRVRNQKISK
jgi:hypothetical protein